MWVYSIKTGTLKFQASGHPGSIHVCEGYSGTGKGRNNPTMQSVVNVGPIPEGVYTIEPSYKDGNLGSYAMKLTPKNPTAMLGRSGMMIHADNAKHDASRGCVILNRQARELLSMSRDRVLKVVA